MSNGGGWGLETHNSSTFTMSGGSWYFWLRSYDTSAITMSGGSFCDLNFPGHCGTLGSYDFSTVTISGGTFGNIDIKAGNSSLIKIVGNAFAVDGAPVPYGNLIALNGVLTGMLANGGSLNNLFNQGGGSHTGTIRLVPEPSTAVLLGAGLLGVLALTRRLAARRGP
jgi:hypothetical protein